MGKKEKINKRKLAVTLSEDIVFNIEKVRIKHPSRKTGKILSFSYWLNNFASDGLEEHFDDFPQDKPTKEEFEKWLNNLNREEEK